MSKTVVQLRFIFANHDGVVVETEMDVNSRVQDLKETLLQSWPQGLDPVTDLSNIRLICMGQALMQDSKTLKECHVPVFPTHPTPINVSLRPGGVGGASSTATKPKTLDDGVSQAPVGVEANGNCCGCIIL